MAVQRMPELPEIETIKSVIEPQIKGLTIENITVNRPEVISHPTADEFCKAVTGQNISSMERRGKSLIINLKNEKVKTPVMAGKEVYSQETKFTRLFMKSASEESSRP